MGGGGGGGRGGRGGITAWGNGGSPITMVSAYSMSVCSPPRLSHHVHSRPRHMHDSTNGTTWHGPTCHTHHHWGGGWGNKWGGGLVRSNGPTEESRHIQPEPYPRHVATSLRRPTSRLHTPAACALRHAYVATMSPAAIYLVVTTKSICRRR